MSQTLGIIGGSGMLGSAIAKGLLANGRLDPGHLWLSNRSGSAPDFCRWPGVHVTRSNQELADHCGIVLLSVPPLAAQTLEINARGRLVISVMAGVTMDQIGRWVRSERVVRAMSSPAAEMGLAYSPWCANAAVTESDRQSVRRLFEAIGLTDEVADEEQIDRFTALTGPVPGFVAYFADCMVQHALQRGIDPLIADRAIRQLFEAAGVMLARSDASPQQHVQDMIAYAGTTAAGLESMQSSPLRELIDTGLDAAFEKARTSAGAAD